MVLEQFPGLVLSLEKGDLALLVGNGPHMKTNPWWNFGLTRPCCSRERTISHANNVKSHVRLWFTQKVIGNMPRKWTSSLFGFTSLIPIPFPINVHVLIFQPKKCNEILSLFCPYSVTYLHSKILDVRPPIQFSSFSCSFQEKLTGY